MTFSIFMQVEADSSPFGYIFNILYLLFFLIYMLYGQKIQMWTMLREINSAVGKLKKFKDDSRNVAISVIKETIGTKTDPTPRVDQYLEYFTTFPSNLDPAGIVSKLEHIIDVRDTRFKDEIKIIAPGIDETKASNLEGVLEVALALNYVYRVVRHFYLLGKKMMSYLLIMQIQMQLPILMQQAKAYAGAAKAFAYGQPIGDGAGAMVAAKLMHGKKHREIAKDIVAAQISISGRKVFVLKAKGPGANIGKYGVAIQKLIKRNKKKATVIMIDAGLKFEGEKTGSTVEGVGTAIGGIGIDQFKIEEAASKFKIPLNSVVIRMSIAESVAPMKKEIAEGVNEALAKVRRLIKERTKKGDVAIVVGVGNTVGIGQ